VFGLPCRDIYGYDPAQPVSGMPRWDLFKCLCKQLYPMRGWSVESNQRQRLYPLCPWHLLGDQPELVVYCLCRGNILESLGQCVLAV